MSKFCQLILFGFLVLAVFSLVGFCYKHYAPSSILASCSDTEDGGCIDSDSDGDNSDIDPFSTGLQGELETPKDDNDPNYATYIHDANNVKENPCSKSCSYWREGRLIVINNDGETQRIWNPLEPYEEDPHPDQDGNSETTTPVPCHVYCPATTAPSCGGACTGCYETRLFLP